MRHTSSRHKQMLHKERQGESRVSEKFMHGLVEEANGMPRKSLRYRWFTLLELLIVIAIIAILASLLMPALKQAKGKVYQSACANNLKQVAIANFNYADDNKMYLPSHTTGTQIWTQLLINGGYLPLKTNSLVCPAEAPSKYENAYFVYGRNAWGESITNGKNLIEVAKRGSSKIGLYLDSIFIGIDEGWNYKKQSFYLTSICTPGSGDSRPMHLRHSGKAECLFGDGHIDAINEKYEYLGNTTLYWYMSWYNTYNNTYGAPPY